MLINHGNISKVIPGNKTSKDKKPNKKFPRYRAIGIPSAECKGLVGCEVIASDNLTFY